MDSKRQPRSKFRPLARPSDNTPLTLGYMAEVVDMYNELLYEYRELDRRTTEREKRYKVLKKSLKDWEEYIKRKRQPNQEIGLQPVTPRIPETSPFPEAPTPKTSVLDNGHQPPFPSRLRTITHAPIAHTAGSSRHASTHTDSSMVQVTSSQSTEGIPSSSGLQPPCVGDESPVVVSTRSLKRKRDTSSHRDVKEGPSDYHNTSDGTHLIKAERHSSPVADRPAESRLFRTETSDLDAINNEAGHMDMEQTLRAVARSPSKKPIATSPRPKAEPSFERYLRNSKSNVENTPPDSGSHVDDDQLRHRGMGAATFTPTGPTHATHQIQPDEDKTPRAEKSGRSPLTPDRHSDGPLQSLSNNTTILPRTSTASSEKPKSKRKDFNRSARAVHTLAEDGHEPLDNAKRLKVSSKERTPRVASAYRLEHLLEGAAESPTPSVISPRTHLAARNPRGHADTESQQLPEQRVSRTRKLGRDGSLPKQRLARGDEPGLILPEHEPLRSRPLHRLNIDDFRIDPKHNDQMGYAYNETVRKREQRRCLDGCTKECCSAIRKMVAADILPHAPRRRQLFDDNDADIDDDELTLQGYFGSGYAQIIHGASAEKKKEMLIEARTKAFADQHGKHRQAFERRNSPPGFWDVDMPTTQEEQEHREEARRMERQRVEERWRVAMRGGGKYIFRDE